MNYKLVETFKHRSRICVVVRVDWDKKVREVSQHPLFNQPFHNGYVSVAPRHHGCDYDDYMSKISTNALTFSGELDEPFKEDILVGKWFLGFNSAHFWTEGKPESKTFDSVRARTILLCDEMIDRGI